MNYFLVEEIDLDDDVFEINEMLGGAEGKRIFDIWLSEQQCCTKQIVILGVTCNTARLKEYAIIETPDDWTNKTLLDNIVDVEAAYMCG